MTFSSAYGVSFEEPTEEDMAARRTIIDTDPPEHTKLRKIVSGAFSQRATAVYEHFIAGLTEQVLDRCPASGSFDFVDAVAKEVPIRVLARIMGLPAADLDLFIDLGDRLIANTDPDITNVVWGRDDTDAYRRFPFRSPYGKQLWDLGRQVVEQRLRDLDGPGSGDDLLSRLLRAEVDGDRLTETDLDNFFSIMVVAGNETTRIAIAQGVLAFCQQPAQWERLRADPGLLDTATDEVIRWSCPTHFMRRTTTTDTTLGGVAIRAWRQGGALACVGEQGRGRLRQPRRVRRRAEPEPAPQLRPRWPASVPGPAPGPAGGEGRARRAGAAGEPVRARR